MLRELRIRNLAVIESARIEFGPGFNVLTGETGAGKSILLDALLLLCGTRAQADLIRSDAESASVQAWFEPDADGVARRTLEASGLSLDDDQLIIRRQLSRGGRHRAFVNDSPVTLAMLERIGAQLVEIHGQQEHQRLLDPAYHLDLLDRFAGTEECRGAVSALFEKRRDARAAVERLRATERDRAQREDLLRFQVSEIDAARLARGEDEALRTERRRLQNAERLAGGVHEAAGALYDEPRSASALLARATQILRELERLDPAFGGPRTHTESASASVEEAVAEIRRLRSAVVAEPGRLEEIDARLDALTRLKRKYGESIESVISHRQQAGAELDLLARHDEVLAAEERALVALEAELEMAAAALTNKRRDAAGDLAVRVQRELRQVGMERALFQVSFERLGQIGPTGGDRAEFLLSTNPGEAVKRLARVVSGGELSRTMLVLKSILAAGDRIPTQIFDEVDAGIGGRVADIVGQKLAESARGRQILCVTHLAQIAARATSHLRVTKSVRGGRTRTRIDLLTGDARVEEIARMLGGESVTETARDHARELLASSHPTSESRPRAPAP
jgi:DNA repair protein RecN (Recombination protein N)